MHFDGNLLKAHLHIPTIKFCSFVGIWQEQTSTKHTLISYMYSAGKGGNYIVTHVTEHRLGWICSYLTVVTHVTDQLISTAMHYISWKATNDAFFIAYLKVVSMAVY